MKPQEATHDSSGSDHDDSEPEVTVMKVHNQPSSNTNYDPNRSIGAIIKFCIASMYMCAIGIGFILRRRVKKNWI